MTTESEILRALQDRTKIAVNDAFPIKFVLGQWDETPNDQKYIEVVHLPNNPGNTTWGAEKQFQGVFRLLLHWPIDQAGAYSPIAVMEAIAASFVKGERYGPVKITEHPDLTGPIEAPPEVLFPLSIRYEAFKW